MEERRLDAVNTNVGLLSDEELNAIYLQAIGHDSYVGPPDVRELYDASATKRVLTLADSGFYLFGAIVAFTSTGDNSFFGILLLLLAGISGFNFTSGILALAGYGYMQTNASKATVPPIDVARLHSPEVLAIIAEYLAQPLVSNARILREELQGELNMIRHYMIQMDTLIERMQAESANLSDPSLAQSYQARLKEANARKTVLLEKREDILKQLDSVQKEVAPIEKQIRELRTLQQASQSLRAMDLVVGSSSDGSHDIDVDMLAGLSARVEMAQQNLAGLGRGFQAVDLAVQEVKELDIQN